MENKASSVVRDRQVGVIATSHMFWHRLTISLLLVSAALYLLLCVCLLVFLAVWAALSLILLLVFLTDFNQGQNPVCLSTTTGTKP